jgi:hypothetical protein
MDHDAHVTNSDNLSECGEDFVRRVTTHRRRAFTAELECRRLFVRLLVFCAIAVILSVKFLRDDKVIAKPSHRLCV